MPTPVSYLSGASLSNTVGMFKRGTMAQNLKSSLESGYRWWNGIEVTSTQYLIYSDTYTLGTTTQANATPVAYSTPDLTDQSLLNLINTLPPRVGQTAFTSLPIALQWLQSSNKFFLIRSGTENIVKSGLQLYIDAGRFDSYIGSGTTWSDLSGNNNNGTLVNGTRYNSSGVGSMVFDGSDDYISFNNISPVSSLTFTISSVVTVDTDTVQYMRVVSKGHYGFTPGYLLQRFGESGVATGIRFSLGIGSSTSNASTSLFAYTTDTFQKGQKYYLTMVSTGSYLYLYVNGVRTGLTKYTGTGGSIENGTDLNYSAISGSLSITTSDKFTIGAYSNSSNPVGEYWNGKILNTIIYNSALSPEQVLQNYNTQKLRFGYYDSVQDGLSLNLDATNYLSYPRSGTTWTDLSGKNNSGTLINSPTFSGGTTPSIVFDGSDDKVQATRIDVGNNLTVGVWFIPTKTARQTLISNSYPYSGTEGFLLNQGNLGTDFFFSLGQDGFFKESVTGLISANKWCYVGATYDGINIKLYFNGNEVQARAAGGSPFNVTYTTNPLFLGSWNYGINGGPYEFFSGNISMAHIYNRALSPQEMIQNFESQRVNFGITGITTNGLVLNLDSANNASYNGSGTTWVDISGSGFDGTLINGPTYVSSGASSSISFDGTDDYCDVRETSTFNSNILTFSLWFKTNSTTLPFGYVFAKQIDGSYGSFWFYTVGSNSYRLGCGTTAGYSESTTFSPNINTWYNIVGVYNGTNMLFYLNGSLNSTTAYAGGAPIKYASYPINLGRYGSLFENQIGSASNIASFQLYNRDLSASEVLQNYNATKSRFGL